jgi:hypothetical protein
MRQPVRIVCSRARLHCRRFARWYLAAIGGSVIYRTLCSLMAKPTPPLTGRIVGQPVTLAHSVLRKGQLPNDGRPLESAPALGANETVQVAIVGAGISGLVAAWELRKRGVTDVVVLEMEHAPGGNSMSGDDGPGGIAYPWGAHYVPLPSRGAVRALLEELGLMRRAAREAQQAAAAAPSAEDDGVADADALCPEPSERLYVRGSGWRDCPDGVLPAAAMTPEDWRQLASFRSLVQQQARRRTADGRPPFVLPLADCSFDLEARAAPAPRRDLPTTSARPRHELA